MGRIKVHRGPRDSTKGYATGLNVITDNHQESVHLTYSLIGTSDVYFSDISPAGSLELSQWFEETKDWNVVWAAPVGDCDTYGVCGPFGVCKKNASPICECLEGFVPRSFEDWSRGNWTSGCIRRTELMCPKNISRTKNDGFRKLSGMKLPDHFEYLYNQDSNGCDIYCRSNCTCVAYSYVGGIGCLVWTGDLMDLQQFLYNGNDLLLRLAHSDLGKEDSKRKITVIIGAIVGVSFIGCCIYGLWKLGTSQIGGSNAEENPQRKEVKMSEQPELPLIEFDKIVVATNNFSTTNKLGAGGFGSVYKGKLENGQEVAVKRLSSNSGQGVEEFKNETILISKLRHRNLVRLLGCCINGDEKLLVYEYMKNRSLDTLLFDEKRKEELYWAKRFHIIQGIARGMLYLHRDSSLRVIHRDLKASNILLDENMNPKVSDFGLARTFLVTEELANTHRVVGTFGYMSPEYVMGGLFSEESDVFSFGVLLLEIVSGTRNTSFYYNTKHLTLLGYAWQLWTEGKASDFIDTKVIASCSRSKVTRSIHIGLLCVQEHAIDRPTMSDVVFMLGSEVELPQLKQPAFTTQSWLEPSKQLRSVCSINQVTESIVEGR